jgi:hypothetical protein
MWEGYFDRTIPDDQLVAALADQFPLRPTEIVLADDEAAVTELPEGARLFVVRGDRVDRPARDSFSFQVTVHPVRGTPESVVPSEDDLSDAEVMGTVARQAGARCLVTDESLDSYQWLLVDGAGPPRSVAVDVDALDENDELVLRP